MSDQSAKQMKPMEKNGFVYNGVSKPKDVNYNPIYGYQDLIVATLREAVKKVVFIFPGTEAYVDQAMRKCHKESSELTLDESAAIYLYTMPTSFHSELNDRLRAENRNELEPWLAFLKLFINALGKLPSLAIIVWRGVASDISSNFVANDVQTWWTVNSCSMNPKIVEFYLGGMGTVFGIQTIHGKDISKYSACPHEEEVILMPGTRIRVMGQPFEVKDKPYVISLKECTAIPEGKHVMLSYHSNSKDTVSKINQILQDEHIQVWFDEQEDMKDNMYDSLANGVENASVVCCFMTPDYEKSENCQLELQYAQKRHRPIIRCILSDTKVWKPSNWLEPITREFVTIEFHNVSELNIPEKARELIDRINEQPPTPQRAHSRSVDKPTYLFELIRRKYKRNSRIERFMNPSKSFPIDQSYINLAIVETKKQYEKENQLRNAQHSNNILDSYEEIYGMKTAIDIKNIFQTCKNQEKKILVFGRAGIGKSTFCRYVAYKWATGSYWPEYELLALIPLRRLTADRYPPLAPGQSYSLIDLMKKEVFQDDMCEEEERLLKIQVDAKNTLWILDGYDEIIQNVPPHLKDLLEQLLKTPHHILTSRPYLNTLSYNVQMEITGFTDENIQAYLQQFFNQMEDELDDAPIKSQTLLSFLKSSPSIWGVAHIPVNLELICSLWSNEEWSETERLTITTLYSMMLEWLCRRYLTSPDKQIQQLSQDEIDQRCHKELAFLESLAFNAMESNTIIIRPPLLKTALVEAKVSWQECLHILNIGILKSFNKQGTGTQIETGKDHYFVHLSFQEYFAARYLINALKEPQAEKAIEFIKHQKYNQRYALVFIFAAGLLNQIDLKTSVNNFWDSILGQPLDLVGIKHMQLVISCIQETSDKFTLPRRTELLQWIAECIQYSFFMESEILRKHLLQSLQRAQSVACDPIIINIFINLLQYNNTENKVTVLSFVSELQIFNPSTTLINSIIIALDGKNEYVRLYACFALGKIGEKSATNEVISTLVRALGDESFNIRRYACEALEKIGEKAATNEVINKLLSVVGDKSNTVRSSACHVLGTMGEKAATNEVINKLVSVLGDDSPDVRMNACQALGQIGEKAATNEVINKLLMALGDESEHVRNHVSFALGNIGKKAATNEVISKLVSALGDENAYVRMNACRALGQIGEKAATNEVISRLVSALGDESEDVRSSAYCVLGKIGEKAATNEVISRLVSALGDESEHVRNYVSFALGNIGKKAATNEVISKLVSALGDENAYVRMNACEALGQIGEKAATNEVINKLVSALGDDSDDVREYAYKALRYIGEEAATNEVISRLVSALGDKSVSVRLNACDALEDIGRYAATNEVLSQLVSALGDENAYVRMNVCVAFGNIGEKAATNEVISQLVSALGDENAYVRMNVCVAFGNIGEKAATNEVISQLVSALGDENGYVRMNACQALGNIGEKAATNEVISQLVSALGDEDDYVRSSAYKAFGKIGEKVATNEVISRLVSALGDESDTIRGSACEALGKIGEKAATKEVISKLVSALGDENEYVRMHACQALGQIGEKAATNEVINKLLHVVGNERGFVRRYACEALGKIGKKAATKEVISKLVSALGDENEYVRMHACEALGQIGEKAATNEVINKLLHVVGNERGFVRRYACEALGKIGEKAAKNEVISKLMVLLNSDNSSNIYDVINAVKMILSQSGMVAQLDPKIIADLCLCKRGSDCLENVSVDQLINVFFTTRNCDWLPAVSQLTLLKGAAVIVSKDKVVVCSSKEPLELPVLDLKLQQQLIEAFTEQAKRLYLHFKML